MSSNLSFSGVTVSAPPTIGTGGTPGCPGTYTARASFRNPQGKLTWTPPTGATQCTLTDVTVQRPANYASSVQAVTGLTSVACSATGTVTFALNAGAKYSFGICVNSPVPAGWTGPLVLQVDWQ